MTYSIYIKSIPFLILEENPDAVIYIILVSLLDHSFSFIDVRECFLGFFMAFESPGLVMESNGRCDFAVVFSKLLSGFSCIMDTGVESFVLFRSDVVEESV